MYRILTGDYGWSFVNVTWKDTTKVDLIRSWPGFSLECRRVFTYSTFSILYVLPPDEVRLHHNTQCTSGTVFCICGAFYGLCVCVIYLQSLTCVVLMVMNLLYCIYLYTSLKTKVDFWFFKTCLVCVVIIRFIKPFQNGF